MGNSGGTCVVGHGNAARHAAVHEAVRVSALDPEFVALPVESNRGNSGLAMSIQSRHNAVQDPVQQAVQTWASIVSIAERRLVKGATAATPAAAPLAGCADGSRACILRWLDSMRCCASTSRSRRAGIASPLSRPKGPGSIPVAIGVAGDRSTMGWSIAPHLASSRSRFRRWTRPGSSGFFWCSGGACWTLPRHCWRVSGWCPCWPARRQGSD